MKYKPGPEPRQSVWPCKLQRKELWSRESKGVCLAYMRSPEICNLYDYSLLGIGPSIGDRMVANMFKPRPSVVTRGLLCIVLWFEPVVWVGL